MVKNMKRKEKDIIIVIAYPLKLAHESLVVQINFLYLEIYVFLVNFVGEELPFRHKIDTHMNTKIYTYT